MLLLLVNVYNKMWHPKMHKTHSFSSKYQQPSKQASMHIHLHVYQESNIYPKTFCQCFQQHYTAADAERAGRELSNSAPASADCNFGLLGSIFSLLFLKSLVSLYQTFLSTPTESTLQGF